VADRPVGTLVDSNVLLDVLTDDSDWFDWSSSMLEAAANRGRLFINPIIYAEVSIGFDRIEELDEALPPAFCRRVELPWEAGFLAGKAFVRYRKRGGERRSPLADFYIGAHAAIVGFDLLTRDRRRYARYFPTVTLIAP
jgi:predicted nucleic acid-binding protein